MNAGDRRRTDRVSIAVPVQVSGTDATRQAFVEQARTLAISRDGATVVLNRKLVPGQKVTISRVNSNKWANARVIGQIGGQPHAYVYGMALPPSSVNLWDILFPPLAQSEKAVLRLLLECTSCRTREVAYLNELEAEVLEANSSLSRSCKHCSEWIVWKQVLSEVPAEPNLSAAQPDSASASAARATRVVNKRKQVRVQLKMSACIRQPGFGEEVVFIENVSRGGLRFLSPNTYLVGSRIEVAVPFAPGAPNIFVPARIVRATRRPDKGLNEYGVTYMKIHRHRRGR